jgi:uncharacterized glyoxalase superfamily protein PhnB
MAVLRLAPMLYTTEIEKSIACYTNLLGFTCDAYEAEWGWASVSRDGVQLMLALPNEQLPFTAPGFTGSFYFTVDNVDELWDSMKDRAAVCYPIEDFSYGMREFAVFDNNGYLLQFGQELPPVGDS